MYKSRKSGHSHLKPVVGILSVGNLSGWDFVRWDFVLWDFVRWDLVRWDFVLAPHNHNRESYIALFQHPLLTALYINFFKIDRSLV